MFMCLLHSRVMLVISNLNIKWSNQVDVPFLLYTLSLQAFFSHSGLLLVSGWEKNAWNKIGKTGGFIWCDIKHFTRDYGRHKDIKPGCSHHGHQFITTFYMICALALNHPVYIMISFSDISPPTQKSYTSPVNNSYPACTPVSYDLSG